MQNGCMKKYALPILLTLITGLLALSSLAQTKTLRFVPQANLTILDPVWSTAYVTRNHAYMIYDTLFSMDSKGNIKPQMVERWSTSKDSKTWVFTLRTGLEFHDGKPVTSEDVVASLKRWASRDALGGLWAKFVDKYEVVDANTFRILLNEPCGIMLDALGKPSSNVPFIMPARIAATSGSEQIKEHIGSGPFTFKQDEFRAGERVVYLKNQKYKSRSEPKDGLAGGHTVLVDRVEWIILRDAQTQFNALKVGEVDWIEQPSFEHVTSYRTNPDVTLQELGFGGVQFILRFNHLHAPFNNPKIRQAAMTALGQLDFLKTQIGVPGMYRYCRSIYPCGTLYSSDNTGTYAGEANPVLATKMLKEAGYDGTPVLIMRPTDQVTISKIPLVAKAQLEAAGFKVDLQQMDWASLVARRAKKDAPVNGGWNIFLTSWGSVDVSNPLTMPMLNATGDRGWFGWQDEPKIEALKAQFARAKSEPQKKKIAEQLQLLAIQTGSHAPLGQYSFLTGFRKSLKGITPNAGVPVFWGVTKE
jgi:peptide/nickel transport system substrate-binding protein